MQILLNGDTVPAFILASLCEAMALVWDQHVDVVPKPQRQELTAPSDSHQTASARILLEGCDHNEAQLDVWDREHWARMSHLAACLFMCQATFSEPFEAGGKKTGHQ